MTGDAAIGRTTLPMVLPPSFARLSLAVLLISWSTTLVHFWELPAGVAGLLYALAGVTALFFICGGTEKADQDACWWYNVSVTFRRIWLSLLCFLLDVVHGLFELTCVPATTAGPRAQPVNILTRRSATRSKVDIPSQFVDVTDSLWATTFADSTLWCTDQDSAYLVKASQENKPAPPLTPRSEYRGFFLVSLDGPFDDMAGQYRSTSIVC